MTTKNHTPALELFLVDSDHPAAFPLASSRIAAGFPSTADDEIAMSLDLNRELVRHPEATFFARVSGESMIGEGIEDGDLLVIDKAVEPTNNCLAVCYIDGEFTLKRVRLETDHALLVPANPKYRPIRITAENEFMIWGIVRYVIKKV
ncbi:MAG: translesion error-prone DNA polymerase V autoproteolytic subunit [Rikenellaceae bacterium]|nr:translesion error-prone DNA polymerase V autoproteolytic subunit [Rikenellaceae bacterium]